MRRFAKGEELCGIRREDLVVRDSSGGSRRTRFVGGIFPSDVGPRSLRLTSEGRRSKIRQEGQWIRPKRRRHHVGTLPERRGGVGDLAEEPHRGRDSREGSRAGDSGGGNAASRADGAGVVQFPYAVEEENDDNYCLRA